MYWRSVAQKLELWRMVNEQPHKLQHTFSYTTLLLSEGVMQNAVTMAQVRVFTHMYMESGLLKHVLAKVLLELF